MKRHEIVMFHAFAPFPYNMFGTEWIWDISNLC